MFGWPSPLSRGVLKREEKGKVSNHNNAEPNSAEMLMKTIVSVNQLSIYKAVLTWYLERRSEGYDVSPNTNLDISRELVTKQMRDETSDLLSTAFFTQNSSVEFKSRGHVSREA